MRKLDGVPDLGIRLIPVDYPSNGKKDKNDEDYDDDPDPVRNCHS